MNLPRLLSSFSVASALLLGGCSQDAAINKVVSASPEVLRDCDRLAMKVLLASYEKAGENQGRLLYHTVSSEVPVKGDLKHDFGYLPQYHTRKGELNITTVTVSPKVMTHQITYYVDEEGVPSVFNPSEQSVATPNKKYVKSYYTTSDVSDGKDSREVSKTDRSLTCSVIFEGEGSVKYGRYTISEDASKIYWSKE